MQEQKAEDDSWQMQLLLHMSPCLQSLEIALHEAEKRRMKFQSCRTLHAQKKLLFPRHWHQVVVAGAVLH
jgi:hypothetical protein